MEFRSGGFEEGGLVVTGGEEGRAFAVIVLDVVEEGVEVFGHFLGLFLEVGESVGDFCFDVVEGWSW